MRFKSIYIYVCLFTFFAITFHLGAGGGSAPKLVFKSWKAGQSPSVTGPYVAGQTTEEELSFLTNEETKCKLQVTVGYAANQPANAYQLNAYEFKIGAKVLLPGLSAEEQKKHTFTFPAQAKQQVAAGATSFGFSGDGTLTKHWGPSTQKRHHCSNYARFPKYNPQKSQQKGRALAINVTFIGYYGTDPNNPQKLQINLPLTQYERDQMRQEYLDHIMIARTNKPKTYQKYGDVSVPSRSEFSTADGYSDAHAHSLMINKNLATKKLHWAQACDKYVGEVLEKEHRIENLHKTGGYRNAHHHVYHVSQGPSSDTAFLSAHQYGRALDVRTVDMDNDGTLENTRATNWEDSEDMADAARQYAAAGYRRWDYNDGHVHAQWGGNSTSSQRVSKAPEEEENDESPPPMGQVDPPETITYACSVHSGAASEASSHQSGTYACGVHSGYLCQASSDHGTTISGWGGSFYECQPHQTFACGHTDLTANSYTHRSETCPFDSYAQACSSGSYYACQSHTHDYPNRIDGACGHTYTVAQRSSHELQASCSETNANGDSCTVTSFYACQTHTHVYPVRATCANGHSYDPDISTENNRHRTRTCRWCSQTWQKCVSGAPQCLVKTKRNCWAIE